MITELRLEREFNVTPKRLFDAISKQSELLQWWGPESMFVSDHKLDFSRMGPWFSTLENPQGQQYKVSGQVTHVDPITSVGFTWGWHGDNDQRGAESHVTLTVTETASGARLIIDHRALSDSDQGASHEAGWTSSLRKLASLLA